MLVSSVQIGENQHGNNNSRNNNSAHQSSPAAGGKGFGKHHLPSCFQLCLKQKEARCGHVNVQVSEIHQVIQDSSCQTNPLRTFSSSAPPCPGWKRGEDDPNSPPVMSAGPLVTAQTVQMLLAKALWPRLLSLSSAGRTTRNRTSIYRVVFASQWLMASERSSSRKLPNCFLYPFIP